MKNHEGKDTLKTVLVVEDEPTITSVCQRVLEGQGFKVEIASNGKQAQEMVKANRYSHLLVDIRTPTMDGKEFYSWLKDNYPETAGHVVFMTGDAMGGDTQLFLAETGQPFIWKPFTPSDLKALIKRHFNAGAS